MTNITIFDFAKGEGVPEATTTAMTETPSTTSYEKYITPKEGSHAEALFNRIGTGRENALRIKNINNNDHTIRAFRRMVSDARKNGDPIVNVITSGSEHGSTGYYRADLTNPVDREDLRHMIKSFLSRARDLEDSAQALAETAGGRYMDF